MACCGLCRPKIKSTIKPKKNITIKKIHTIDTWMENIEGPYESIDLPTQPPDKPMKISNQDEIIEAEGRDISNTSEISQNEKVVIDRTTMKSARQNLNYLSSDFSTSENDGFIQQKT
jgi:hypothetical protein